MLLCLGSGPRRIPTFDPAWTVSIPAGYDAVCKLLFVANNPVRYVEVKISAKGIHVPSKLFKQFKILLRKAALPNIRFHDLRHTAATLMLQQGIHPKVVQEHLGHADISLTLSTYSHVLPNIQEKAAEKFDLLLIPPEFNEKSEKLSTTRDKVLHIEV